MPFSHHSHSGQFCAHAKNDLEECVLEAISKNMRVFCLTEHMPRANPQDIYPEEADLDYTPKHLFEIFADYYSQALELREKYKSQITLLIGFEVDWIRPSMHAEILSLMSTYKFDLFIGSVHHVDEVSIDFSKDWYQKAIETVAKIDHDSSTPEKVEEIRFKEVEVTASTGEERLYEAYFDTQYSMLTALKPPIIGHFDLIRLLCSDYKVDFSTFPGVYSRILRNIKLIKSYGGLVEINSAAVRKGWEYPYPGPDVMKVMVGEGVKFVLSDDSHGTAQVGFGYKRALEYLEEMGVEEVSYFEWKGKSRGIVDGKLEEEGGVLPEIGGVEVRSVRLEVLKGIVKA
ncbi:Histidinol-phosphatase [Dactylella cylindrospora]|nr:Histidinol-phosphatase [Dactylella cylindrospora]